MKKILFLIITVAILSFLSGCGLLYQFNYSEVEAEMIKHLEDKYSLQITEGKVGMNDCKLNGESESCYTGVFYDKRDPNWGIQVTKYVKSGDIKDYHQEDVFQLRLKVAEVLKKYRPNNQLNSYFDFSPQGQNGDNAVEWSAYPNKLSIYFLKEDINIDKELKNDYSILKEVEQLLKEELGKNNKMNDGYSVIYFEKDEFNLKDYLKRSEHAKFYQTQINKNFMPNQLDDILEPYYKNQNDPKRPKRMFEYHIKEEHKTYQEFEKAVKESAKKKEEEHLRREEIYGN